MMTGRYASLAVLFTCAFLLAAPSRVLAQGRRGQGAPPTPRAGAPIDLTGYWVSVVTEDWRARMAAPVKGERPGIPLNAAGVAATNAWDPTKDEASGDLCKAYGAPGVMRAPGRLRIAWVDDNTLKIDTEAGTQTRLLRFGAAPMPPAVTFQGDSAVEWEFAGGRRGRGTPQGGSLKSVTTHLRPGYVQRNGVPYGANATLTEYFSRTREQNGDSWLVLTAIVDDPQYFTQGFVRSSHFKKLPDTSAWEPEPCSAR